MIIVTDTMPHTQTIQPIPGAFTFTVDDVYDYNVFFNGYYIGQIDVFTTGVIAGCDYFDSHVNDYLHRGVTGHECRLMMNRLKDAMRQAIADA